MNKHPEEMCERCQGPNVWSWHAPSPLWNAVLRDPVTGDDRFSIICPPCFAELAEASGVVPAERHTWHFAPEGMNVVSLWADPAGRVWDDARCLWMEPALGATHDPRHIQGGYDGTLNLACHPERGAHHHGCVDCDAAEVG